MTEEEYKLRKSFSRDEWNDLRIYETKNWYVNVRQDQHLLGWLIIVCKDMKDISFPNLETPKLIELTELLQKLELLLTKLFKPDRFNYLQAGNVDSILHIHLIPRYKTNREFNKQIFTDPWWGKMFEKKLWKDLPEKDTVIKLSDILKSGL
jgi:diadenosine tetraphosphate (Ap4A) HIT family hydrolase